MKSEGSLWGRMLSAFEKDFIYVREIQIDRSSAEVFAYLRSLENFKNWNPFLRKDSGVQLRFRGTDGQPGFVMSWQGNKQVGSGEQEITQITDGKSIEFELRFKTPFAATNQAAFEVASAGTKQSIVRWRMQGRTIFPMSLVGVFINFEKVIGGEFALGLKRLKEILEGT